MTRVTAPPAGLSPGGRATAAAPHTGACGPGSAAVPAALPRGGGAHVPASDTSRRGVPRGSPRLGRATRGDWPHRSFPLRRWGASSWGSARWGRGAASTSSTAWRSGCCRPCPSRCSASRRRCGSTPAPAWTRVRLLLPRPRRLGRWGRPAGPGPASGRGVGLTQGCKSQGGPESGVCSSRPRAASAHTSPRPLRACAPDGGPACAGSLPPRGSLHPWSVGSGRTGREELLQRGPRGRPPCAFHTKPRQRAEARGGGLGPPHPTPTPPPCQCGPGPAQFSFQCALLSRVVSGPTDHSQVSPAQQTAHRRRQHPCAPVTPGADTWVPWGSATGGHG